MTETPKYSRQEISDESKRKSTAEEIRTANKGVDKKKTPEGKKELSQTWVQKANLTPAQKQALCDELLVKDIDAEKPQELERRVIALQKHLGFPEKDCDGILGWKTLEKVDQMVEDQHKLEDEEGGIQNNEDGYGFDRVANEETKEKDRTTRKEKLKTDLASGNTEGLTDADGKTLMLEESNGEKLLKGTGDNSDKYYNIETDTYETKAQRDERIAKQKKETQDEKTARKEALKSALASGQTEGLTDADGKTLMIEESNGEKLLKGTGDNSDKYYNIETDTYETKAQRDERIAKQKKETQDEKLTESQIADIERAVGYSGSVDDTIDASGYNLDPSYEYKKTEGSIQRTKDGTTEVWDTTTKKWENTEARNTRLAQEEEKKSYEEHNEDTRVANESYLTKEDNDFWGNSELKELKLSEVKSEIEGSDDFSDEERNRVNRIMDNINDDIDELGGITMGEYLTYARNPSQAADRFAPTDKPGKLPGKLGEYGMEYQKKGDITLKLKDGGIQRIITRGEDGKIKEQPLSQFALETEKETTDLPNGGRITRTTLPNGEQVVNYYDKKDNSSPNFVFKNGKWEAPSKVV